MIRPVFPVGSLPHRPEKDLSCAKTPSSVATGGNADAKALAQKIIDAQQAEITEMRDLLTRS